MHRARASPPQGHARTHAPCRPQHRASHSLPHGAFTPALVASTSCQRPWRRALASSRLHMPQHTLASLTDASADSRRCPLRPVHSTACLSAAGRRCLAATAALPRPPPPPSLATRCSSSAGRRRWRLWGYAGLARARKEWGALSCGYQGQPNSSGATAALTLCLTPGTAAAGEAEQEAAHLWCVGGYPRRA